MTQYDIWTMDKAKLVGAFKNACIGYANGKETAPKAIEIFGREILRRLAIVDDIAEEIKWNNERE